MFIFAKASRSDYLAILVNSSWIPGCGDTKNELNLAGPGSRIPLAEAFFDMLVKFVEIILIPLLDIQGCKFLLRPLLLAEYVLVEQ